MKKKKKAPKIIPRKGPPTNLRKAGAHEDKKRKELEEREKDEAQDLIALGSWAFEDD